MQVERIIVNFNPVFGLRNRRRGLKRFSCFSRKRTDLSKKKLHGVCTLTKVYQYAKEERFLFFWALPHFGQYLHGVALMKQECSVIVRWRILFLLDFVINSFTRLSERQRTWSQIGLKTKAYRFKKVTILCSVWASHCTVRIEAVK